jgi:hypothetical protein
MAPVALGDEGADVPAEPTAWFPPETHAPRSTPIPSWVAGPWCAGATESAIRSDAATTAVEIEWTAQDGVWRWHEGDAAPRSFTADATATAGPCPVEQCLTSPDGRYRAWSRELPDHEIDIQVRRLSDAAGGEPTFTRSVSTQPLWDRAGEYIADGGAMTVATHLRWLPGASARLAYHLEAQYDAIHFDPYEAVDVYDADAGQSYRLFEGGEVWSYDIAVSGNPLVALTADEIRVIETADGSVRFSLPAQPENVMYGGYPQLSPDNTRGLVFVAEGLLVLDLATGDRRLIRVPYEVIGRGEYGIMPRLVWREDGPPLLLVSTDDNVAESEARTDVWQLDLDAGTAEKRSSFVGSALRSSLLVGTSADARFLATNTRSADRKELVFYLGDLETGQQAPYARGHDVRCCVWSPGGHDFVVTGGADEGGVAGAYLGHVCRPPSRLPQHGEYFRVTWLDDTHFAVLIRDTDQGREVRHDGWVLRLMSVAGKDELVAHIHQLEVPDVRLVR